MVHKIEASHAARLTESHAKELGFSDWPPPAAQNCALEQPPGAKIVFVFSCPGKEELAFARPAVGNTGRNLARVLAELRGKDWGHLAAHASEVTPEDWQRGRVCVANAWDRPLWKGCPEGRTEALASELRQRPNLERFVQFLKDAEIVVLCGRKAQLTFRAVHSELDPRIRSAQVCHLGGRGLNTVKVQGGTEQKLKDVANQIWSALTRHRDEPEVPTKVRP